MSNSTTYSIKDCPWFQKDDEEELSKENIEPKKPHSSSNLFDRIRSGEFANNTSSAIAITTEEDNPWNVEERNLLIRFRDEVEKEFLTILLPQPKREELWSATTKLFKDIWGNDKEPAPDETTYALYEHTMMMWRKGISYAMALHRRGIVVE